MAARKDMMRIIRRDAGFSATLGFGSDAADPLASETAATPEPDIRAEPPVPAPDPSTLDRRTDCDAEQTDAGPERPDGLPEAGSRGASVALSPVGSAANARGAVVYVAVSLTAAQAPLAEAWARAAHCSVPFLIRRVAQGLRGQLCEDWQSAGMPVVEERRGTRGKVPTSVTLTLPQDFAAAMTARHDPLGIVGLGRAMGPAFRARFQDAFDAALAEAGFRHVNEGTEE